MQPIHIASVQKQLGQFAGEVIYVHVETTNGAYAAEGLQGQKAMAVGAHLRNVQVQLTEATLAGAGPYRAGLGTTGGWIYAEGLTHWLQLEGQLFLYGLDAQNRLTVALQLSRQPYAMAAEARQVTVEPDTTDSTDSSDATLQPATTTAQLPSERHVLVILPHPDDETLACGGTIAMYSRAGTPVTYACGTLGELGRNFGNPPLAMRETLPALREGELREACRILGISDLRLLGLRDKTIEFVNRSRLVDQIRQLIVEINPSLVLTYHPQYSVHPDHLALGAATIEAWRSLPEAGRPALHTRAFGRHVEQLGPPDRVVDARPVMDVKLAAVRAHRSQTEFMLNQWEAGLKGDPAAKEEAEERWAEEKYWFVTE